LALYLSIEEREYNMELILDRYTIYLNNPEDDCSYFETYEEAKKEWDKIILQWQDATMTKKTNNGEIFIK